MSTAILRSASDFADHGLQPKLDDTVTAVTVDAKVRSFRVWIYVGWGGFMLTAILGYQLAYRSGRETWGNIAQKW